eukprot:4501500-Prymnesium_polylepis.1
MPLVFGLTMRAPRPEGKTVSGLRLVAACAQSAPAGRAAVRCFASGAARGHAAWPRVEASQGDDELRRGARGAARARAQQRYARARAR